MKREYTLRVFLNNECTIMMRKRAESHRNAALIAVQELKLRDGHLVKVQETGQCGCKGPESTYKVFTHVVRDIEMLVVET